MDYQFEQSSYSDSQFFKDRMSRKEKIAGLVTVIAGRAYCVGGESHDMAVEKNIRLVSTYFSGKSVDSILEDFVFDGSWKKYSGARQVMNQNPVDIRTENHSNVMYPLPGNKAQIVRIVTGVRRKFTNGSAT